MIHLLKRGDRLTDFVEAGQKYIATVTSEIENLQIYPRLNSYRDLVLLALLDRIVTTAGAVIRLVSEGFADQAYGLSRTAVEAFFALKYIENKDSEVRAKRYLEYFGKDREHLLTLIGKHHPHLANARPPDYEQLMKMAKNFKSPHRWYSEPSLKEIAYEKSTWAVDNLGQPEQCEYAYDIVYKLTSHEVHATSVALETKIADFLENSRYPAAFKFSKSTSNFEGDNSIVNVCIYVQAAIEHVFHAFDFQVPFEIRTQFQIWKGSVGIENPTDPNSNP
jgi:hypothetical protein